MSMSEKRGRGRPELPASERRHAYAITLNAKEREAIALAAKAAGVSMAVWCRATLLAAAAQADSIHPSIRMNG